MPFGGLNRMPIFRSVPTTSLRRLLYTLIILSMLAFSALRAWMAAYWMALNTPESVFSLTLLIAAMRSLLPRAIPILQPVML